MDKTLKITKEQYDRIFASGLIKESKGKLKITREQYNRLFSAGIIKENFDAPSIGVSNTNVDDNTKTEILELLKYMYRETKSLSPFWKQNGLSYEDIKNSLLEKGVILEKEGKCKLSKTLGNKELAKKAFEDECLLLLGSGEEQVDTTKEVGVDETVYGGEFNPNDPTTQPDPVISTPTQNTTKEFELVFDNGDVCLFNGIDGNIYVCEYESIDHTEMAEYAKRTEYTDNQGDIEYSDDYDVDGETIERYLNDVEITIAQGYQEYVQGGYVISIVDDEYKQELLTKYRLNGKLKQILLGNIDEVEDLNQFRGLMDKLKTSMSTTPQPFDDKGEDEKTRILAAIKQKREQELASRETELEETTSCGSAMGAGTPVGLFGEPEDSTIKRPNTPVVAENTTVTSAGNFQYDTNTLPGIKQDGKFVTPKKSKSEKTPQWSGGEFVEQPECSKLNNNKEAQKGGCNSGSSSLKTKKASGSINAPSLGENKIYEAIANKTGLSIEGVKKIIESKTKKL